MNPGQYALIEPIAGRCIHVPVMGRNCRSYFEEGGQGIPPVCLHTAGADGRQYRHMSRSTPCSRAGPSGAARWPARCRAAGSRWWRLDAR